MYDLDGNNYLDENELRHKQNLIQNIESGKRNISAFEQDLIKRSQQLQSKN